MFFNKEVYGQHVKQAFFIRALRDRGIDTSTPERALGQLRQIFKGATDEDLTKDDEDLFITMFVGNAL